MQQKNFLRECVGPEENVTDVSTFFIATPISKELVFVDTSCEITVVLLFSSPQNLSIDLSCVLASTHFLLHILLQLFGVRV